jgi:hypothetical protein
MNKNPIHKSIDISILRQIILLIYTFTHKETATSRHKGMDTSSHRGIVPSISHFEAKVYQ